MQSGDEVLLEMDDGGSIKDDTITSKNEVENDMCRGVGLTELSDEVLLYILDYCSPRDLRSLQLTCSRFSGIILEKTLWRSVDARDHLSGNVMIQWMLDNALHSNTRKLLLNGNVRKTSELNWPERIDDEQSEPEPDVSNSAGCGDDYSGSMWTLSSDDLLLLRDKCSYLTSLSLEYYNLDWKGRTMKTLPPTLKILSLRGSWFFNMERDNPLLSMLHEYLPELESLDVSECDWLEPSAFLPLSKLPKLRHLFAANCKRLVEFMPYSSLSTRFGFKELMELDLRGTAIGDQEVAGLGLLPSLQILRLSSPGFDPEFRRNDSKIKPTPVNSCKERRQQQKPELKKNKSSKDDADGRDSGVVSMVDGNQKSEAALRSQDNQVEKEDVDSAATGPHGSNSKKNSDKIVTIKRKLVDDRSYSQPGNEAPSSSKRMRSDIKLRSRYLRNMDTKDNEKCTAGPSKTRSTDKSNNESGGSNSRQKASIRPRVLPDVEIVRMRPDLIKHSTVIVISLKSPNHVEVFGADEHNLSFSLEFNHRDNASNRVSDMSVRTFGENENYTDRPNYVNITMIGPNAASISKHKKSRLRSLTITGYRDITDESLDYLSSSAPELTFIDFRGTSVTAKGVENFKVIRPDCTVLFGEK